MPAIFISHSSSDAKAARRLAGRLEADGFTATDLFLDIHPEYGLKPGVAWETELYRQVDRCDAVIFWASPTALASRWCFAEIALARALGRVVFDVGVGHDQDGHELLRDRQAMRADDEVTLHDRLLSALVDHGMDPRDSFSWDARRAPYPGLEAFNSDDAAVFHGRDDLVRRLYDQLDPRFPTSVAVIGPSGSGKSSLVRAGLIPRIQRQDPRWVVASPFRPGTHGDPFSQLARAMIQLDSKLGRASALAREIRADHSVFRDIVIDLLPLGRSDGRMLVTLDQGEELFTGVDPETATEFLALLAGLREPTSPCSFITTIRSEFLSQLLNEDPPVTEMSPVQILVAPLARSRLAEVIERPARRTGLRFDPGVVGRLVADTPSGDALPLLAFALRELWDAAKANSSDVITMGMVDALGNDAGTGGGVVGALTAQADRAASELRARELVVPTLMKLARVEARDEPTRRRVRREAFSPGELDVVDAFVRRRLLKTETAESETLIEVTHEALLRQWPPLREAIEDQRGVLSLAAEIERAAEDWLAAGKDGEYCLSQARLRAALAALSGGALSTDLLLNEFLDASVAADRGLRNERADEVARQVLYTCDEDAELAASRALHAAEDLALTPLLARALNHAMDRNHVLAHLRGHSGAVLSVRFSAFGDIATASEDGEVRVWRPNGTCRFVCDVGAGAASDASFSPDGRLLVTSHLGGRVHVWDIAAHTPAVVSELGPHPERVRTAVFDPTGQLVLTACEDGLARLWQGGRVRTTFSSTNGVLLAAAFSPDGQRVVTAGSDPIVRAYDALSGDLLREFPGHEDWVRSPNFSPDGQLIISASEDATARLWETETGLEIARIDGHRSRVRGAGFIDADHLVTASGDATCRTWSTTGVEKLVLRGHRDRLRACAVAPGGKAVATASEDQTARLWSLEAPNGRIVYDHGSRLRAVAACPSSPSDWAAVAEDGSVLVGDVTGSTTVVGRHAGRASAVVWRDGDLVTTGHDGVVRLFAGSNESTLAAFAGTPLRALAIRGDTMAVGGAGGLLAMFQEGRWQTFASGVKDILALAFSPDGQALAAAGADSTIRVWSTKRLDTLAEHSGHGDWVRALAFSPDGRSLLSGSEDATLRLWHDDAPSEVFASHDDWVRDVRWTSTGDRIVSCSGDGTIRVWREDGALIHVMSGHGDLVGSVSVAPDDISVLSASHDGTIRSWRTMPLERLVDDARTRIFAEADDGAT
ncbi:MAG: TIR domain-containing protein [Solirubrobacteraceae bacterium]